MLRSKTGFGILICLWLAMALTVQAQQSLKTVEELATALLAAKSEQERAALLDTNQQLATISLTDALGKQAQAAMAKSNFAEAMTAHQLARQIAERHNDTKQLVTAMIGIGGVHLARAEFQPAIEVFHQALKLAEPFNDATLLTPLQSNLCQVNLRLGNYDLATEHCRQSLALAETVGDRTTAGNVLNLLGIISRQRGDLNQALEFYRQALAIKESLGDKATVARILNNIGVAYRAMGNETAALRHYLQSLPIAEEVGNRAGVAGTLNNITMVYRALGNYKLALDYSQRSLAISEAIGDKKIISEALQEIGKLHSVAGDYEKALEVYRKSLTLAEATGEKMEIAIRLMNVGSAYRNLGNYAEAIEYFRRSIELADSIGAPYTVRAGLHHLGHLYLHQGKFAESLENSERAITLARQGNSQNALWQSLLTSGVALRFLKQPEAASPRFEESIRIIETARAELAAGASEQAHFLGNRADAYIQMVMLAAEQGRVEESLHFAERAKARVLLDTLTAGKADISKTMTDDERRQERRLKDELTNANSRLSRAVQAAKPNPQQLADLKTRLEKARLDYESFQSKLYAAHPELRSQRGEASTIKPEELAAMVDDKTALLEFVVAGQAAYLFAITRASGKAHPEIRIYTLPIKQDELTKQATAFRQQLAKLDLGFRASAKQLYATLLKPAAAQLTGKTRLVIVPDAALWELPFQALIADNNRYLIETAAVSYAPSLTVLREMQSQRKQRANGSTNLLAFGNPAFGQETIKRLELAYRNEKLAPLPEAEAEVRALGQLYGAGSKVFTGSTASEDRLKSEAQTAGILHIATHGILNDAAPMYSHLALATSNDKEDGQKEDGLLEAWELMQLNLKADLAVLSACETARGKIGAGEGVIGLSWAMFVAGVPSTLVSQWKVESSSTRDLMVGFHRGLRSKIPVSKTEALRQAVLSLLKKPETNHPFYWAGFVLIGDGQ